MIDQAIKSLDTGAPDITYEGNEGVKSPEQEQQMMMAQLQEEYDKYVFEMKEQGIQPMSIEQFIEQIMAEGQMSSRGPIFPSPEDPVNPFGPKPMKDSRQMAAFGGIMGLDQRRQYGLGSRFKRFLNKATRPFTKIAQKLTPKELAGPLRTIAPFLPPGYREAAYLAGTAKQKGKFNIGDLAFVAAPYARFEGTDPGEGIFGSRTKFKGFGREGFGETDDFGIRDLITGGEADGAYEDIGGKGLLGKIKLGESDLGQYTDELMFGKAETPDSYGIGQSGTEAGTTTYPISGQEVSPGILGSGGEMSVLGGAGGAPGIMDSKAGQLLFGDGEGGVSKLKLGSWAIGIVSGIQAGKYKDEQEAADAAEAQLLATNQAASDAEIQAARDWAIETFGNMSVYADGGRIGFEKGTPDPGMMQGMQQGGLGTLKDFEDMEIKLMIGDPDRNNLPAIKMNDGRFLFNGRIFDSEEALNKYMLELMPFKADGGRINKNMGGEFNMPPAGLSSLQTQASDVTPPGMELDLRGGGFIPIGKAEKADDVPARVSKNEFVFTADAVKAAGGGSVNEGAKKMYDTMKRLESQVA